MDKIDQLFRMQQLGFAFYAVRDVYMAHLDKDEHAPPVELSEEDYEEDAEGRQILRHGGRFLCQYGDDLNVTEGYDGQRAGFNGVPPRLPPRQRPGRCLRHGRARRARARRRQRES